MLYSIRGLSKGCGAEEKWRESLRGIWAHKWEWDPLLKHKKRKKEKKKDQNPLVHCDV